MEENTKKFMGTALVTGASRGIGKAIATALAKEGYHLILTCKNSIRDLAELSAELTDQYEIMCRAYVCDMGKEEDVEMLFSHITALDLVVNNAGIAWLGLLSDMTGEEWREVMATNLDSVFYTSKKAIPLLLHSEKGKILNISSVWGNVGASTEVAYSASKGGVNAFTKALAKELAPGGIAVNAIACGVVDTDMNRNHLEPEELEALQEEIPAGRMTTPEEVAQLVCKLVTAPSYMTGQIITMDGGWT